MKYTLFKRRLNKKIQVLHIECKKIENHYEIIRFGGLLNQKYTEAPIIYINHGKSKRTLAEQADLEFTSLINSYRDKGYKTSDQLNILDVTDLNEVEAKVPKINLDQNGALKPMLAKHYKDIPNFDWNKTYYASIKLDGTRSMIFKRNGKIVTSSRGGKNYNTPATYI